MKNLFLSLALVLVSGFAFANEPVKEVEKTKFSIENQVTTTNDYNFFGNCNYTIVTTTIWPNGSVTQTSKDYSVWALSLEHCESLANRHVKLLNEGIF